MAARTAVSRVPRTTVKEDTQDLSELRSELETGQEAEAELREAQRSLEALKAKKDEARERLHELLAPLKNERATLVNRIQATNQLLERAVQKQAKIREQLRAEEAELRQFESELSGMGVPVGLLGTEKPATEKHYMRLTPAKTGEFDPIIVEGMFELNGQLHPRRLTVWSDGERFFAAQIRKDQSFEEAIQEGPVWNSTRLSKITTAKAWMQAGDVAYGIAKHLGLPIAPNISKSRVKVNDAEL